MFVVDGLEAARTKEALVDGSVLHVDPSAMREALQAVGAAMRAAGQKVETDCFAHSPFGEGGEIYGPAYLDSDRVAP